MARVIATANQFAYKRNFLENRWQDVGNTACKVQVKKKSGEFYLHIRTSSEEIVQRLSQEKKLHLSNGFVQIPIADKKELYGIKFTNTITAEEFYGKVAGEMGQGWNNQKVLLEHNDMPRPYSTYEPAKPLAETVTRGKVHQSMPHSPKPPRMQDEYKERPMQQPQDEYKERPMQQPQHYQQQQQPQQQQQQQQPQQQQQQHHPQQQQQQHHQQPQQQQQQHHQQPQQQQQQHHQQPPQQQQQQQQQPLRAIENYGNNMGAPQKEHGRHEDFGGQGYREEGPIRANGGGQGEYQDGGHGGGGGMYVGGGYGGGGGGAQGRDGRGMYGTHHGGGRQGNVDDGNVIYANLRYNAGQGNGYANRVDGEGCYVPGGGQRSVGGDRDRRPHPAARKVWEDERGRERSPSRQQQPAPPRAPLPVKPEQMPHVVASLMSAVNKRSKEDALKFLNVLLASELDVGSVDMRMDQRVSEPSKQVKEFTLCMTVEFQQRRAPILMFLDAQESDTIDLLQTKVQVKFFIPKASQNWIIGDTLVTLKDTNKKLSDYDINGDYLDEIPVFIYVMHAKKANVPKEEYEVIRSRQMQQRKQQQQQQEPQQDLNPVADEPAYDVIHHPGISRFAPQQQQQQQQQQQYHGGGGEDDSTYSTINVVRAGPGGQENFVTRTPAPRANEFSSRQPFPPGAAAARRNNMDDPQWVGGGPHQRKDDLHSILNLPPQFQNLGGGAVFAEPLPFVEEEKKVGWECSKCTYFNTPQRPGCELCGNERPADYMVPIDVPMDESAQKAAESERLFLEFTKAEKEREAREAQANYLKYLDTDNDSVVANKKEFDCPVCYTLIEPGEGITLRGCVHQFCKECLRGSVVNSPDPEVKCPFDDGEYTCGAPIAEREIKAVVSPEELEALYRKGLMQAESAAANSFHCRTNNCRGFCFYEDEVNEFHCPTCMKKNCLLCKAIHEDMDCQEYQDDLKRRAANDQAAMDTQKMLEELVQNGDAMYCPQCKVIVQKKDGCDWIRCVMCKTEICWATKGPRWGPAGHGDTSGGCKCRVNKQKCHPECKNCH